MKTLLISEFKERGYYQLENDLEQMSFIQQWFAKNFAFENIDVLLKNEHQITEKTLIDKLLKDRRGGLCYELNGLLHLILKAFGFDVTFGAATVWSEDGWIIDKTHTINLYRKNNDLYLLDSGSGSNLAMQPLKLDGHSVTSSVGTFRLKTKHTERGSIISEKKTDDGWVLRYAFDPVPVHWDDLNRIKDMIHHHRESPFNQTLLFAKTFDGGTISITNKRLNRKWNNGREERITFNNYEEMLEQLRIYATKATYEAAKLYVFQI